MPWLGRGEKVKAEGAARDAMNGVFDLVDIAGEVVISERSKDNAPGLFLGDKLGTRKPGSPRFGIDGTTNLANGLPNSISVIAASQRQPTDLPR
jgi:fructose-1,6-bisphosphatase II